MVEITAPHPFNSAPRRRTIGEWFRRNPVTLKEMRSRMRGRRAFIVITIHVGLLSIVVSLIYAAYVASNRTFSNPADLQTLGKVIFNVVVGLQLLMMCFISPSLTVGAISAEREHQTFDLLRTTLLSARELVQGKLLSALSFSLLLMVAALPLQSLAFLFGGITIEEVFIGSLMLVVTAIGFSAIGLFFSSLAKRTLVATALSNGATVLLVVGLPIITFVIMSIMAPVLSGFGGAAIGADVQARLVTLQWILVSISPLPAGIATQAMLSGGQGAWSSSITLGGGSTLQVVAPWIIYVSVYLVLSAILIALSIRIVNRPEI